MATPCLLVQMKVEVSSGGVAKCNDSNPNPSSVLSPLLLSCCAIEPISVTSMLEANLHSLANLEPQPYHSSSYLKEKKKKGVKSGVVCFLYRVLGGFRLSV